MSANPPNAAVEAIDAAIRRAVRLKEDLFRFRGPAYKGDRGTGFSIWNGGVNVGFDPEAEAQLETAVSLLAATTELRDRVGDDAVREAVFEAASSQAGLRLSGGAFDSRKATARAFEELARAEPTLLLFPIRDLEFTGRIRTIGPLTIGKVSEALETNLAVQLQEAGRGFRFDASIPWVDRDEDSGRYATQLVAAIRTTLRGHLAVSDAFTRLELLFATVVYLALQAKEANFRLPTLGTTRNQEDVQSSNFEESAEVIHVSPTGSTNPITITHGWEILTLEGVMQGRRGWGLLKRMLALGPTGSGPHRDSRFGRFLHALFRAHRSQSFIDRLLISVSAIEALVGSGDAHEPVVSMVSERVARLLPAKSGGDRLKLAREMKKLYDLRSSIVHGSAIATAQSSTKFYQAAVRAEALAVEVGRNYENLPASIRSGDDLREWFDRRRYRVRDD
jgi:hypothetical protein